MVHVSWDDRHVVQYQLGCSRWGYFCQDSGWGDEEATVVCREQGFSYGLSGECEELSISYGQLYNDCECMIK